MFYREYRKTSDSVRLQCTGVLCKMLLHIREKRCKILQESKGGGNIEGVGNSDRNWKGPSALGGNIIQKKEEQTETHS
jgi:hypothetical protein